MPEKRRFGPRKSQDFKHRLLHFVLLAAIWGGIAFMLFAAWCALDLPDIHQVTQAQRRPSIAIAADDGTVFAGYGDRYGQRVTLADVPRYLPEAIISIEDRRFYSHFGIDIWGLLRAAARDAAARHVVQGGSTLTQQLAKNLFLSPERTLKEKFRR